MQGFFIARIKKLMLFGTISMKITIATSSHRRFHFELDSMVKAMYSSFFESGLILDLCGHHMITDYFS